MNVHNTIDEARLGIMLKELRLPTIKTLWPQFAEQANCDGWPAARFLPTFAEHELAEWAHRRIERHLAEAHLPPGKTVDIFAYDAVPMASKAQVIESAIAKLDKFGLLILDDLVDVNKDQAEASVLFELMSGVPS